MNLVVPPIGMPRRRQTPPLRVFVDREEVPVDSLEPARDDSPSPCLRMRFTLPAGTTSIRLASPRHFHEVDTRQLGVAIQQITVDEREVALDGPAIRSGFYRLETGDIVAWRWTNGDALMVLPELPEEADLAVVIPAWSLPPPAPTHGQGMRAAVVTWDICHNPVGRAHVLHQLLCRDWVPELVGPAWRRFGTGLWEPLRDEPLTLRSFPAATLVDVWTEGAALALTQRYNLVVVSKPRLPALVVGLLLAEQSCCPLIVDIDEAELAFMEHHGGGAVPERRSLIDEPFGILGTELAARTLGAADARTASSPILQMEYAAHLVRHCRDETAPVPKRLEARRRLGFSENDFVICFAGTVRPHKGLDTVLRAIEAIGDSSVRLMLVGPVYDPALRVTLAGQPAGRVVHHEGAQLTGLGNYLVAADLVPLLQHPDAPIAASQLPAKLADALQHGVPVVASNVPPLHDLARRGVVDLVEPQDFTGYLKAAISRGHSQARAQAARRVFETEFGLEVNRARLDMAIDEAFRNFNPTRGKASEALAVLRRETHRARRPPTPAPLPKAAATEPVLDLVFFWKQNDSDLFGRRSDMVARYLGRSGRFRQILHLDLPMKMFDLSNMASAHREARATTGALQLRTTLARALGLADEPGLYRSVMMMHSQADASVLAGLRTHDPAGFGDFVLARMHERGMDPATSIAWVCPVVWGFGAIAERLGFARVVVDLIDDQRAWKMDDGRRAQLQAEYEQTLRIADLVLTNCEGNRLRFLDMHPAIMVVPNGAEFDQPDDVPDLPAALASLPRPIIGYIGNLRDRVDWDLVTHVAVTRPDWSIAMIGPLDNPEATTAIAQHRNVHMIGPVRYETMRVCSRHFDVAIVPHRIDAMTASMNPLKVYNYLAADRPVVTTAVANLDDVQDFVAVAADADGFVAEIERQLAAKDSPVLSPERREELSWRARVAVMLRLLDGVSDQETSAIRWQPGECDHRLAGQSAALDSDQRASPGQATENVATEVGADA